MKDEFIWWKHGVIYQIYPRSFFDSNDDGIGDLQGIIRKLDYLDELGINAIWLSPINMSPMCDFGYDISDYTAIDPIFGTMDDFDELLKKAHQKGMKIIMDLVLNHTSDLHPWFLASKESIHNPKRDWYIWKDGKKDTPPNNWICILGNSAWKWDETTCQYYLHSFLEQQPDLNWRNSEMKNAMFQNVKFWLDKRVDGFRLDVVNYLIKDEHFRNNPTRLGMVLFQKHVFNRDQSETHELLKELRQLIDKYPGKMLVGEITTFPPADPKLSARFLGNGENELHLAFDFSLIYRWWNARLFYRCIKKWNNYVPGKGWPCYVLSNHDQHRSASKYGSGKDVDKRTRVAATLLLTLRGTPFIYYGEEIGMTNLKISRKEICDPVGKKYWPFFSGRDISRGPMNWSTEIHAGFSKTMPWLPICKNLEKVNVKTQKKDRYSLLNFYKNLISLRKKKRALSMGEWIPVLKGYNGILGYYRVYNNEKLFVILNFTRKERKINIHDPGQWKVRLSTHRFVNTYFNDLNFTTAPYEATILEFIGRF